MSDEITVERQVEALLAIVDELDEWTAEFVRSLNARLQHGRNLTTRQWQVLLDKFDDYDPLKLKPRRRRTFTHPRTGKSVSIPLAVQVLSDNLHALGPSDAHFVQRAAAMIADGGGVTERAAYRIEVLFVRARPQWGALERPAATIQPSAPPHPLPQPPGMIVQPTRGKPDHWSVTVLGPTPSAEISRAMEAAMAERSALKGPLH